MRAAPLLLAALLTGCLGLGGDEEPWYPTARPTPASPVPLEPLFFGGVVVDALTGAPVQTATIRLDLSYTRPCRNQGLGWTSWEIRPDADGAWGPLEIPRPRSDEVAFFLHVLAPGYTENATFIGAAEARGDIRNITVVLHPEASVSGWASPGTIVALDDPGFPRFAAANESGAWRFDGARVVPASLVIAELDAPLLAFVTAPAQDVGAHNATRARGWVLEGVLRNANGAPLPGDVAAWNGTRLWSAGRAGDNGVFVLPLQPEPVALRIEARTAGNTHAAVKILDVDGPPALREALVARPLC